MERRRRSNAALSQAANQQVIDEALARYRDREVGCVACTGGLDAQRGAGEQTQIDAVTERWQIDPCELERRAKVRFFELITALAGHVLEACPDRGEPALGAAHAGDA